MKHIISLVAGFNLASAAWAMPSEQAVLSHYADLAHAKYEDSLITAKALQQAVNTFVAQPQGNRLKASALLP